MQINSVVSPGGMSGVPSQNRDEPQNAKMSQPQLRRYRHRKLKRRPAVRATIASGKANARILGTACIIAPENLASLRGDGEIWISGISDHNVQRTTDDDVCS